MIGAFSSIGAKLQTLWTQLRLTCSTLWKWLSACRPRVSAICQTCRWFAHQMRARMEWSALFHSPSTASPPSAQFDWKSRKKWPTGRRAKQLRSLWRFVSHFIVQILSISITAKRRTCCQIGGLYWLYPSRSQQQQTVQIRKIEFGFRYCCKIKFLFGL